jgi:Outer membrane protein beta-barrel domain/Omptin family
MQQLQQQMQQAQQAADQQYQQEQRQQDQENERTGGWNAIFNFGAPMHLGGPISLSMYGNSFAGVGASTNWSNGYKLSDTAGIIAAPNALTPGYRSWNNAGGINLSLDASRLLALPTNQGLLFGLSGAYDYADTRYMSSAQTPGGVNANAASTNQNIFTLTGSATYFLNKFYLKGVTSFDWNTTNLTTNFVIPGTTGKTNGGGYHLGITAGEYIPLFGTIAFKSDSATKTPPPNVNGGYMVMLDVSGHYAYSHEQENSFTDTTGFVYGDQKLSYNDVGVRGDLMGIILDRELAWMPFVGVAFDKQLGLSDTFNFPAQLGNPSDTLIISPSTNWLSTEVGLNLLTPSGTKFGVKAFYQTSTDTQSVGGSVFLRIPFEQFARATDSGIRVAPARTMAVKAPPPPVLPAYWSWAGLYIGAHVGGALSVTNFSDPFGSSIYGDQVRSPGFLGGGQIGYNWQAANSPWVFGVEADASFMASDGDVTCFATSSAIITTTCHVQPQATGTFTGRVGYALGPSGRTLVYAKGGFGWANDEINMALSGLNVVPIRANAIQTGNSQNVTLWGGTVGVGVEQALTPAWSLKAEYDYLGLARSNVANIGNVTIVDPVGVGVVSVPPGTSSVSQNIQEVKLGLNYKWGTDPRASGWKADQPTYTMFTSAAGWEVEGGGRYFASWGQFQKDLGGLQFLGQPASSMESRLTYDNMQTNSGEFFGRIDTPWNLFVKGYVGGGVTNTGQMNDEDSVLINHGIVGAYSNTLSPAVTGNITYGAIDGGFDFMRGAGYKVGLFGGYFAFNQDMSAFGCVVVAFNNCTPNPVPTSGSPVITENDKWTAVRIGLAAEAMLTDRVKLSGDVAYLPWVWFNGTDQHFVGNTGALNDIFLASGKGNGVQIDALLSYYLTPQWSVGLGGRYWGMWTTPNGQWTCTSAPCLPTFAQSSYFKAQVEQLGAFVQTSYKFDWGGSVATLH